jgi:hypothetical protein
MNRGDAYKVAICNHTGTLAIYNKETDHFYSPLADGPIQYDILDKSTYIPNLVTKYGKEFSIVEIPYSFKLLMQELTSMNVQMRLITADNIEQLTKQGDRRINDRQFNVTSASPGKEEDIFERLKRENEQAAQLSNKNFENVAPNQNGFIVEPELLSSDEKKQLLNMYPTKREEFINSHSVNDLTPAQRNAYTQIIERSKYYSRLESEMGDDELYKTILRDEIDRMFEPTNSELGYLAEMNKLNQTQGNQVLNKEVKNQPVVINKLGSNEESGSNDSSIFVPKNESEDNSANEGSANEDESENESGSAESGSNESSNSKKVIHLKM